MLELVVTPMVFAAMLDGHRKHHVLTSRVGAPEVNDPVRIAEIRDDGTPTGATLFAIITWVDVLDSGRGPVYVFTLNVRASTGRMKAVRMPERNGS